MRLKTLLATAVLLAAGTASSSAGGWGLLERLHLKPTAAQALQQPFQPQQNAPAIQVQANPQTQQMEEIIRQLSGKVEELNFQVLQLQEQMRKMQEDNEFRFQELEKSGDGTKQGMNDQGGGNDVAAAPSGGSDDTAAAAGGDSADAGAAPSADAAGGQGTPPKELGTIKFDEKGNPIGGTIDVPADGGAETASLPDASDPAELYRVAYDHILAGEYEQAEAGFRQHVEQFPADAQTADARYWLGESLASQGKHRDAAEILLDAQRDFPKSKKAPDMLLKLGMSLAALDNKDVACATYNQVLKKYPKAGATLLKRVAEEQSKAGC